MMRAIQLAVVCVAVLVITTGQVQAALIAIDFDVAQANYTPLPQFQQQVVDDQFAPLGILFRDGDFPSLGVVVNDLTFGAGSDPVHLYGNNNGSADTTPNINFFFVDPSNWSTPAFTDFVQIRILTGTTTMTAFDSNGNVLGVTSSTTNNQFISLSNIGAIARINLTTPEELTGYDDLSFNEVMTASAVPEPSSLAIFGIGACFTAGGAALRRRREKKQQVTA